MAKKNKEYDQGEIIAEIRSTRAALWKEYKGDMKKLSEDAKKIAKKYGLKYAVPPKKTKKELDEAA